MEYLVTQPPLTTTEAAVAFRTSRGTIDRICAEHPGFAFRVGRSWRIPQVHVELVLAGETPAEIAARLRVRAAEVARAASVVA